MYYLFQLVRLVPVDSFARDSGSTDKEKDVNYVIKRRDERNLDFAPPSAYFNPAPQFPKKSKRNQQPDHSAQSRSTDPVPCPTFQQQSQIPDIHNYQPPSSDFVSRNQREMDDAYGRTNDATKLPRPAVERSGPPAERPVFPNDPTLSGRRSSLVLDYDDGSSEHIKPFSATATSAGDQKNLDLRNPWGSVPPPAELYSHESSRPMVFGHVSQAEIREQVQLLFTSRMNARKSDSVKK